MIFWQTWKNCLVERAESTSISPNFRKNEEKFKEKKIKVFEFEVAGRSVNERSTDHE